MGLWRAIRKTVDPGWRQVESRRVAEALAIACEELADQWEQEQMEPAEAGAEAVALLRQIAAHAYEAEGEFRLPRTITRGVRVDALATVGNALRVDMAAHFAARRDSDAQAIARNAGNWLIETAVDSAGRLR